MSADPPPPLPPLGGAEAEHPAWPPGGAAWPREQHQPTARKTIGLQIDRQGRASACTGGGGIGGGVQAAAAYELSNPVL